MIFGDWISTNISLLWSWGQIARFRKISATPPRPSPSMELMEREEKFRICHGFKPFRASKANTLFKPIHQPGASGLLAPPAKRGERIKERGTRKQPARLMSNLIFRKLGTIPYRPSPSMELMEREKEAVGSIGLEPISKVEGNHHFKRTQQPCASGFLAPPAKRGERIKERGDRKQPMR